MHFAFASGVFVSSCFLSPAAARFFDVQEIAGAEADVEGGFVRDQFVDEDSHVHDVASR